ncbi:phosphopyruvate hydratase [Candidatus Igneacidithiobacillus taiwanensis]|uniref:phosphopyruvate hydratase n=1 Tax=Candidatus Igneacidithiobacillus taiwanensis TaxID=1945924 RepID=UPI00289AAD84|nr:phosphopyruvate hydratase [Candidatus Igneacidithiobacillus taiwanensis]
MNAYIQDIIAREILDSRGNPTVEAEVLLTSGQRARAAVPSGASTGSREAIELRDGDPARFGGKGVRKVIEHIEEVLAPDLIDLDVRDQKVIDDTLIGLDGTYNKGCLGANALLAVSMACARAAADAADLPLFAYLGGPGATRLPVPCFNVLNGGVHAHWQGADFQECMLVPYGADSFRESLRWGAEIYHALQAELLAKHLPVGIGDEGGFAPAVLSNHESYDLLVAAIHRAGFTAGKDCGIAIDAAASEFFHDGKYQLRTEDRELSSAEMIEYFAEIVRNYPVVLLEDGLAEDDWENWKLLNERLGAEVELVGDDIFCTNPQIIQRGIDDNIANAALIKLNQIGTVTETLAAARLAQFHHWGAFVSHRSGETTDDFIADLAVALDTGHIKSGAPARGERVAKYNQLLRIEEQIGTAASFAGKQAFIRPVRF